MSRRQRPPVTRLQLDYRAAERFELGGTVVALGVLGGPRHRVCGTAGGDFTLDLHRLYGDVNGDKAVNGLDLAEFRKAFGASAAGASYRADLDLNGDGTINGSDLVAFRTRFGVVLP